MCNLKNLMFCVLFLMPMSVNAAQEFKFVNAFGEKGAGEAQFAKTVFMAFGPDGAIYVTDTDNFRIQKFNEMGVFVFDIQMQAESEFRFINPTAIAIGTDSSIYVMDWMFVEISAEARHHDDRDRVTSEDADLQEEQNPKIFNYGPCIHKFDASGVFVASYPIQDLSQRIKRLEAAAPGLDADGNYALIIPQGDTRREFLLATDAQNNLYVCDSDVPNKLIIKLDAERQDDCPLFP